MKSVLILLSTYNGHKFLREQLDSLYAQEGVDIHILARDDGSKDNTVDILNEYYQKNGRMSILAQENIGCARSFFFLMSYAVTEMPQYDYYAFSDQDDIWHPDKLHRAIEQLNESKEQKKLYFCSANFVDANLRFLAKYHIDDIVNYRTCLYKQPAVGCTMVFTRSLLEDANRIGDDVVELHDAWLLKCACYLNAYIISDETPMINYRQHGHNVTTAYKNSLRRFFIAFKDRVIKRRGVHFLVCKKFYEIYKNDMPEYKRKFMECVINYKKSFHNTFILLKLQSFEACSCAEKFLWRLLIIFRCY